MPARGNAQFVEDVAERMRDRVFTDLEVSGYFLVVSRNHSRNNLELARRQFKFLLPRFVMGQLHQGAQILDQVRHALPSHPIFSRHAVCIALSNNRGRVLEHDSASAELQRLHDLAFFGGLPERRCCRT